MTKKGYYIHLKLRESQVGVRRKIDGQLAVLRQYFDVSEIEVRKEKINILQGILSRLPFGSYAMDYDTALAQINDPSFVYIRHTAVDRRYYFFLKKIREKYPAVKMVLEIPTYPYNGELLTNSTMWPFYFKDLYRRKMLKNIVDRIVTFSDYNNIFEIPTIKTQNGVMVDALTPVKCLNENISEINLIAVSACISYHGYERCIRGLADYYGAEVNNKIVKFHIVGEGDELSAYKSLVQKYRLEQYVLFYGKKTGTELEAIYDMADVAMSTFGLYKINLSTTSPLKTKEYLAKGLPVVSGFHDKTFTDQNSDFCLEFPNDDSNVDIKKIIDFYEGILEKYKSKKALRDCIREYAKKNVDMSKVMESTIEYLL